MLDRVGGHADRDVAGAQLGGPAALDRADEIHQVAGEGQLLGTGLDGRIAVAAQGQDPAHAQIEQLVDQPAQLYLGHARAQHVGQRAQRGLEDQVGQQRHGLDAALRIDRRRHRDVVRDRGRQGLDGLQEGLGARCAAGRVELVGQRGDRPAVRRRPRLRGTIRARCCGVVIGHSVFAFPWMPDGGQTTGCARRPLPPLKTRKARSCGPRESEKTLHRSWREHRSPRDPRGWLLRRRRARSLGRSG